MTTPEDDESAEPVILENDDQDTVLHSRALPEVEPAEQDRLSPEQMPTIGHVGRYALKYCIGEGGLGTVYAAHDPLLSRLIAIKTMQVELPEQDREQFNALFLNEARAAGSLSHPHIVTVFDAGAGSQGTYMAMELLRGKDLRQLLAVGWRPTPEQAALIIRRVADAVSYAHHKGVVHRDLKPANIFMLGRTQPRVLDFGIARIRQVEAQMPSEDGLSRFGDLVGGSPHYMAPEQVRREPTDRRADVYSLGVVLYELLTGRRPFSGADLDEITAEVLSKPVRPPHETNPDVPEALSMIAMRAMARDPSQRTRSARTLSKELREWLSSQDDGADAAKSGKSDKAAKSAKLKKEAAARAAAQAMAPTEPAALDALPSGGAGSRNLVLILALAVGVAAVIGGGWWAWRGVNSAQSEAALVKAVSGLDPVAPAASAVVAAPAQAGEAAETEVVESPSLLSEAQQAGAASGAVAEANLAAAQAVAAPAEAPVPAPAAALQSPPVAAVAEPVKAPVPTGTVKLAVSPWGRVFVGRKAMGVTPPLNQLTLPQGRHTIVIKNDEFPAYQQTIEVKAGQAVSVSHAF